MASPISPPCKNCEQRHVGCHSKCEKYINYRQAKDNDNEQKRQIRLTDAMHQDVIRKGIQRAKRAHG